jgi:hypothetical protein
MLQEAVWNNLAYGTARIRAKTFLAVERLTKYVDPTMILVTRLIAQQEQT